VPFPLLCRAAGLPELVPEFRFHPIRRWRIDFAFPAQKVGLEVDGGIWTAGRHTRGAGWSKDTEKLNTLAAMGWRMLRCTPTQLADGSILPLLAQALTPERHP
jgi:very-short-patch-repair endonuclease